MSIADTDIDFKKDFDNLVDFVKIQEELKEKNDRKRTFDESYTGEEVINGDYAGDDYDEDEDGKHNCNTCATSLLCACPLTLMNNKYMNDFNKWDVIENENADDDSDSWSERGEKMKNESDNKIMKIDNSRKIFSRSNKAFDDALHKELHSLQLYDACLNYTNDLLIMLYGEEHAYEYIRTLVANKYVLAEELFFIDYLGNRDDWKYQWDNIVFSRHYDVNPEGKQGSTVIWDPTDVLVEVTEQISERIKIGKAARHQRNRLVVMRGVSQNGKCVPDASALHKFILNAKISNTTVIFMHNTVKYGIPPYTELFADVNIFLPDAARTELLQSNDAIIPYFPDWVKYYVCGDSDTPNTAVTAITTDEICVNCMRHTHQNTLDERYRVRKNFGLQPMHDEGEVVKSLGRVPRVEIVATYSQLEDVVRESKVFGITLPTQLQIYKPLVTATSSVDKKIIDFRNRNE